MKVTISKALKLKSRLIDSMEVSKNRFLSSNISTNQQPAEYNSKEYLEKYQRQANLLVGLKVAIQRGNDIDLIYRLSETKNLLNTISRLNTNRPMPYNYGQAQVEPFEYSIACSTTDKDVMIQALKLQIADLQDELDAYNARTEIEIPELEF